jgi:hypothetical protein
MVGLKEAIDKAIDYAKFMNIGNEIFNMRVEEVRASGNEWQITLGWDDRFLNHNGIFSETKRIYKVFNVNKTTGNINEVVIRE